ncbi:pseudouridine synthase [Rhodovulum sp. PH10]|uniref:RluA family pseudouridine synthase n=1 Tax=Rhodovulum sp. PH10 TaxID=1187851 RepID=UPI00027C2E00|nr:RNA pseudouridine synthase [Rhodovulum sp. PH10]EJW09903.1 pseudouridine synthase [Rhodovulum sp. PH10]
MLHRDGLMIVIDKPAGLPVHRGPKGGGSLEDGFDALRFGLPRPPALAHRLDRETSGCLVLGRHRKALAHLGLLFKHGQVKKTYWAVVEGGPEADEGVIDLPLGRLDETRGWWMRPDPAGQPAVTTWRVLGRSPAGSPADPSPGDAGGAGVVPTATAGGTAQPSPAAARLPGQGIAARASGGEADGGRSGPPGAPDGAAEAVAPRWTWLALSPLTGRTHQLRVHCAASGFPIVGDNIYGNGPRFGGPGLHLHAREIVVPLSKSKPPVRVVAPIPAHLKAMLTVCGWDGDREP